MVLTCVGVYLPIMTKSYKLHVLVNNSGISWGEPFEKYTEVGWDRVMDLNMKGVFFLTKAVFGLLQNSSVKDDPARIINIGSIFGMFMSMWIYSV
jgi:NAD(P)-dependent dehydrogenase (short-subunit alcohol dehydrogenase family)